MNETATPQLNKALSLLQGELPKITKTKTAKIKYQDKAGGWNSHEYSYADLGDVVADVGPLLAKHGLAFHCAPTVNPADRREMVLLWSLLHESGEEKTGEWPLGPANQKPQSLGSAITYGRRYCFTAATNIVLEDDDDGQRAQQDHGSRQEAGDLWEQAAPAPPRQQRKEEPQRGTRSALVAQLLRQAADLTTEPDADRIITEAAAAHIKGHIDRAQNDYINNSVRKRLESLRKTAKPVDVEDLARAAQDAAASEDGPAATLERHQKLIGTVWAHLRRLGYPDDKHEDDEQRAKRLADTARLAGVSEIGTTSDLDLSELALVADTLSKCKNRAALARLLDDGETSKDGEAA